MEYQNTQKRQYQKPANKFEGNPCIKCGNTIRYRRSGGCVDCSNASAVRESKDHEIKKLKARIQSLESEVAELKKRLEGSEL